MGDRIHITANGWMADKQHRLDNGSQYVVEGFEDDGRNPAESNVADAVLDNPTDHPVVRPRTHSPNPDFELSFGPTRLPGGVERSGVIPAGGRTTSY